MKTRMGLMGLMGVMLLAGCAQKPDVRIPTLEAKVLEREADCRDLNAQVSNLVATVRQLVKEQKEFNKEATGLAMAQEDRWRRIELVLLRYDLITASNQVIWLKSQSRALDRQ